MTTLSIDIINKIDSLFLWINELPQDARTEALARIKEKLKCFSDNELERQNNAGLPESISVQQFNPDAVALSHTKKLFESDAVEPNVERMEDGDDNEGEKEDSDENYGVNAASVLNILWNDAGELAAVDADGKKLKEKIIEDSLLEMDEKDVQAEENINKVSKETCPFCREQFESKSDLQKHKKRHHNNQLFQCEVCGKGFRRKGGLALHLQRHKGVKAFECPVCSYSCAAKIDMLRHIPVHTKERSYICEFCGKAFATDTRLRTHVKGVHLRSERLQCELCDFVTHSKVILKRHHVVKHTDEEKLQCPVCNAVIRQRGSFLVHMRIHTGEKPYGCELCDKRFKSNSELKSHERTHGQARFVCPTCGRGFLTRVHLKRHGFVHTGEKPFSCSLCDYACNVKGNLAKHVRSVHRLTDVATLKRSEQSSASLCNSKGNSDDESEANKRGIRLAEKVLKSASEKLGVKLTVEELQKRNVPRDKNYCTDSSKSSESTANVSFLESGKLMGSGACKGQNHFPASLSNFIVDSDVQDSSSPKSMKQDILSNAMKLLTSASPDAEKDCPSRHDNNCPL